LPPFTFALVTLVLIIVAFPYAGSQPYSGLFYTLSYQVYDIALDSPADQAGLQAGDQLIKVDGVPIEQMSPLYGQKKAGDTVVLSILRGDQLLSLSLVLTTPPFSVIVTCLEPLLIALSFWFIAVVVLALKPTARDAQLFFLFCLVGAGVLAAGELSSFHLSVASSLFGILLAWLSPLVIHFHAIFPQRKTLLLQRLSPKLLYGLGLGLSLPYVLWPPSHLQMAFWFPWLSYSLRIIFALSALAGAAFLLHTYRTTQDRRIRRQVRLVVIGTAWASAPLALLSLLPEALTGSRLVAYEVSFLTLPLIPLSYAVAIYKYNLLDIDRFLNRSLVHFILAVFWVGSYLLLVAALNVWLPDAMFARPLLGALVTLVMAMTLVSLRQRTQRWVDRAFYGGWYDYRSVVAGVSAVLSEAQDEAALVEQLIHRVATTMGLKGAALFLASEENMLTLRGCTGFGCLSEQVPLSLDGSLAQLLRQKGKPLEHSDVQRQLVGASMSDTERAWLTMRQVQLWIPLVFKGELKGLLLMGSKEGNDFFSIEDLRILKTLAHQAALAAENILLLESLRRQVKELTFLSSELEATHRRLLTSREDERKRLARDLHDQLLQDLFALNIGLQTTVGMVGDDSIVERLGTMRQDVTRLADEVRRLCVELRPPSLSILGLADAIRSYTNEWAERRENIRVVGSFASWDVANPNLTITLELAQDRKRLDDQVAIALFRVYQEALVNVEKHATAENVWVREQLEKDQVELNIRDDGRGFDVPKHLGQFVRQGHFGLLGGQERMAAVGGGIQVTSEPGAGTELHAWAPVNGNEDNV
jgi:signal transduction histidine kinase